MSNTIGTSNISTSRLLDLGRLGNQVGKVGNALDRAERDYFNAAANGASHQELVQKELKYRKALQLFETVTQLLKTQFDIAMRAIQRLRLS